MSPEGKVKLLKAAWDAIGSEFGSRHTQYEMFYAGARFVTCGHSFRNFDWGNATGLVEQLLLTYDLQGELSNASTDTGALVKIAIVNLGQIVSGDWRNPFVAGDTILTDGDKLAAVGSAATKDVESADVVIDAGGMTAIPGLIDSHVHITFGDYTPRQRTVGYLESYLHGGTTTAISASEVHVPGRPSDPEGVKALAVAAQRCFASYRPGGMKVIAGSVILEPGLTAADFKELAGKGVKLAKAGFGAVKDRLRLRAAGARRQKRRPDHHLPHRRLIDTGLRRDHRRSSARHASARFVSHQRRPTAMPDADFERVIKESEIALQVCTAGNLRTVLLCARLADRTRRVRPLHHRNTIRRPAPASCRSACSTPSRIARA